MGKGPSAFGEMISQPQPNYFFGAGLHKSIIWIDWKGTPK